MTATPRPVPRHAPEVAGALAPDLNAQLEATAELPLEERAAQLAAIHEMLASELRRTEN